MKIKFGYYFPFDKYVPNCWGSDSLYDTNVIATYISTLNDIDGVSILSNELKNPEINWEYIGSDAFDAYIDHDMVKVGFDLLDGYDEDDEIDEDIDHSEYLIPRKELIYLLEKWLIFMQKPIIDPDYREIIDTEDAYK